MSRGFTLIELLITISLVGILSALAIVVINPVKLQGRARDANRKTAINQIRSAVELYYSQNRAYPTPDSVVAFGGVFQDASANVYLRITPQDPRSGWGYCYHRESTASYVLCAAVEDVSNIYTTGMTTCTPTGTGKAGDYCVTNPF